MALTLNTEQILALAPDTSSAKAGKGLAHPQKWIAPGHDDQAVWGACQGSGATPYQTSVDLGELAFKCSCPSRKFPCKHALGLLLLLDQQPAVFTTNEQPAWVAAWLEGRARRATKHEVPARPAAAPAADPDAQAKRASQRHARTAAGLDELERWLHDLARQGLIAAQSQPASFWHTPATRMVDAQAPGVARLLRQMAAQATAGKAGSERLLTQMGRLYLLIEGFKRLETLPPETQADIRATLGWTQSQNDLLTLPGLRDRWLVVGQQVQTEDRLQTQTTWLWGHASNRAALVLDFAHGSNPLDKSLVPGLTIDAELVSYPGAHPLRALVKMRHTSENTPELPAGYPTITAALEDYATALARCPWLERFPMLLRDIVPTLQDDALVLRDSRDHVLSCAPDFGSPWPFLAQSGGHPVCFFGEWDGARLRPLTAWP